MAPGTDAGPAGGSGRAWWSKLFGERRPSDWLALIGAATLGIGGAGLMARLSGLRLRRFPDTEWWLLIIGLGLTAMFLRHILAPLRSLAGFGPEAGDGERYRPDLLRWQIGALALTFYLLLILVLVGLILVLSAEAPPWLLPATATGVLCLLLLFGHGRFVARRLKVPWTRPTAVQTTTFGRLYALFGFALGLVAFATGINLLYGMLGMLGSVAVVSVFLSLSNLHRLEVSRELPSRVRAGESVTIQARIKNRKRWLGSFSLWIEEGWPLTLKKPAAMPRGYAVAIPGRGTTVIRYPIVLPRRGVVRFPGLTIESRFPFGMFARFAYRSTVDEVEVWPSAAPLPSSLVEAAPRYRTVPSPTSLAGQDGEFRGLRDYVPGVDDPRRMHWPSTARYGTPVVRETDELAGAPKIILLEGPPPEDSPDREGVDWAAYEAQIGIAASLLEASRRIGSPVTLAVYPHDPVAPLSSDESSYVAAMTALAKLPTGDPLERYGESDEARKAEKERQKTPHSLPRPWSIAADTNAILLPAGRPEAFSDWADAVLPARIRRYVHRATPGA